MEAGSSWWGNLQTWIDANLVTFRDGLSEGRCVTQMLDVARDSDKALVDWAIEVRGLSYDEAMEALRTSAPETRATVEHVRDGLRPGNTVLGGAAVVGVSGAWRSVLG